MKTQILDLIGHIPFFDQITGRLKRRVHSPIQLHPVHGGGICANPNWELYFQRIVITGSDPDGVMKDYYYRSGNKLKQQDAARTHYIRYGHLWPAEINPVVGDTPLNLTTEVGNIDEPMAPPSCLTPKDLTAKVIDEQFITPKKSPTTMFCIVTMENGVCFVGRAMSAEIEQWDLETAMYLAKDKALEKAWLAEIYMHRHRVYMHKG